MLYSLFREPPARPIVLPMVAVASVSDLGRALRERAEDRILQLRNAVSEFKNVCYANSLGSESVVLTGLIWEAVPEIDIVGIDTRRVRPGENARSGGWRRERGDARECGLHPRGQEAFSR
jgi:hypothetical protein